MGSIEQMGSRGLKGLTVGVNKYEIVEKVHLIFWTELRGVTLPYLNKRSSIVDRITKPLFLTPYKEICSGAFSTVSMLIV